MVKGGVHGKGGVCDEGGCAWQGVHAWDMTKYRDTSNERAVRILLECILVVCKFLVQFDH